MPNKVFVVTDVTSTLGKALAAGLALSGERVVMVAREPGRGGAALQELTHETKNRRIDMQLCNLAILSSVRNLAEILKSRYERIDVLINNSSVYRRNRRLTVDGYEEMFAANHLGPFLLTNLVLERLQAAVEADGSARVLNVAAPSTAPLEFDDLQGERNFNPRRAFEASQTAKLLFTFELARRLENSGITSNAVHPGLALSALTNEGFFLARLFRGLRSPSPQKASAPIVEAAAGPQLKTISGKFLEDGKEIQAPPFARERAARQRLWELSEVLSGLAENRGVTPVNDPHLDVDRS